MENTIGRLRKKHLFPDYISRIEGGVNMEVYIYGVELRVELRNDNTEYHYSLIPLSGGNSRDGVVSPIFVNSIRAFAAGHSRLVVWMVRLYDILNSSENFEIVRGSCTCDDVTLRLSLINSGGVTVRFMIMNFGPSRFAYSFRVHGMPTRVDGTAGQEVLGMNPDKILRILGEVFDLFNNRPDEGGGLNRPDEGGGLNRPDEHGGLTSMLESWSVRLDRLTL